MGWAALGGAGLGAAKYYGVDKPQEKKDRQIAAVTAQYSPWTGMKPQDVKQSSAFGDVLQGGTMGLGMGQNLQAAANQNAMQDKQGGLIDAQTNYYNALGQGAYAQAPQQQGSAGSMGNTPWNSMPMKPYGPTQQ